MQMPCAITSLVTSISIVSRSSDLWFILTPSYLKEAAMPYSQALFTKGDNKKGQCH